MLKQHTSALKLVIMATAMYLCYNSHRLSLSLDPIVYIPALCVAACFNHLDPTKNDAINNAISVI